MSDRTKLDKKATWVPPDFTQVTLFKRLNSRSTPFKFHSDINRTLQRTHGHIFGERPSNTAKAITAKLKKSIRIHVAAAWLVRAEQTWGYGQIAGVSAKPRISRT